MTAPERNCTSCRHYRPAETETAEVADYGECRAHPPVVVVMDDTAVAIFPQVTAEVDCGEWRAGQ